ncbi:hypothetical protein, partial [Pseudomonas sp. GW456-12-1-14-TSB6]|uniref:hypothetical protein n=1 Tax=Pseudomonas sp. GW456-12-1-14-TSB6 TaxID=2751350 RepID=UPI001A91C556
FQGFEGETQVALAGHETSLVCIWAVAYQMVSPYPDAFVVDRVEDQASWHSRQREFGASIGRGGSRTVLHLLV